MFETNGTFEKFGLLQNNENRNQNNDDNNDNNDTHDDNNDFMFSCALRRESLSLQASQNN